MRYLNDLTAMNVYRESFHCTSAEEDSRGVRVCCPPQETGGTR